MSRFNRAKPNPTRKTKGFGRNRKEKNETTGENDENGGENRINRWKFGLIRKQSKEKRVKSEVGTLGIVKP